ncbi:hypothetical protein Pmani_012233 [Petrolisthes manimaculis]|uniref:Uncharacterized protein n=1 Tax=Petrolisthes manimaculis TaxID=1843537 RepID=A0AAE1PYB8_9EUCA|nr:hypothetical protein Pmani_012233 [Petrolisthes manimaculis]
MSTIPRTTPPRQQQQQQQQQDIRGRAEESTRSFSGKKCLVGPMETRRNTTTPPTETERNTEVYWTC